MMWPPHVSSCSLATPNPQAHSVIEKGRRLVNKKMFDLWNEEYRDGIKTSGDKIGMSLCIIKPLNDVRCKFSADTMPAGNTSCTYSSIIVVLNTCTNMYL